MDQFVRASGRKLVVNGAEMRFRGVNIGNWLLIEHFMIGLPWTEYKMREVSREVLGPQKAAAFFDAYMDAFVTEADIRFLAQSGLNLIRLPFNYRHFESDAKPFEFRPDAFRYFDRIIEWCRTHDTYVLLDLHAAAGVQARDWNAESAYGEAMLWEHAHFQERTAALWRFVAERYKDEPRVFGYEVLNEPLCPDVEVFNRFNRQVIKAIRSVDANHLIVVESNEWGKKIATLATDLFDDAQVMPSSHHYHGQFPPFDRLTSYPGVYEGRGYGRKELAATLAPTFDYHRIDRPVLVGEFGIGRRWGNHAVNLAILDELIDVFEELGFHWTIWSYKDVGAMGIVSPRAETPWKRFQELPDVTSVREVFWQVRAEVRKIFADKAPLATDGDFSHFWGQSLHHWHAVTLPRVLGLLKGRTEQELAEMAKSFVFDNCEVDQERMAVLRKHTKK
jgi:hypothetical protein